jgi:hypothetical protein
MGWDGELGMMLVYRIVKTSLSLIISLNSRSLFCLSTHSEWKLRYLRELKMLNPDSTPNQMYACAGYLGSSKRIKVL